MSYYYSVGNAYCVNGVHYDPGGSIEDDQPYYKSEKQLSSCSEAPTTEDHSCSKQEKEKKDNG